MKTPAVVLYMPRDEYRAARRAALETLRAQRAVLAAYDASGQCIMAQRCRNVIANARLSLSYLRSYTVTP